MTENRVSSPKSWLTAGLIVILCVVNLLLIKQNLDLRKQLAAGGRTLDLTTNFLKPGDIVAAVTATDLNGRPYQLEYKKDSRHLLLLFFSPNCPYCEQQSPLWRELLNKVDSNRFTVVGVVSDKEDKQLVSALLGDQIGPGNHHYQADNEFANSAWCTPAPFSLDSLFTVFIVKGPCRS